MSPCVVLAFLCSLCSFAAGGDEEIRTLDPLLAGQVLSQLSYTPGSFFRDPENRTTKSVYSAKLVCLLLMMHIVRLHLLVPMSLTFVLLELRYFLHRKEVIQPHLPIRLPCYDLTPIIEPTLDSCLLAVSSLASGVPDFHGLTGGVYKARERIHRGMLIRDY